MKSLLDKLHTRIGDLWWYSLMIFVACRSGDVIQAFIGLWLVPKYVGSQELGAVIPLQNLSSFFTIPLAIVGAVFVKFVNVYATREELGKVKDYIRCTIILSIVLFGICIVITYVLAPLIYERLRVTSGSLTVLVLASGFIASISQLFNSALQGLNKFSCLAVCNVIGAPIRLITLFVFMPFRALSGYVLGQATPPASTSCIAFISIKKELNAVTADTTWRHDIRSMVAYGMGITFWTAGCIACAALTSTLYRQRLPELESAAYYMLTKFSETGGYVGASLMVVLFPMASESYEHGLENRKLLRHCILGSLVSSFLLALIFSAFCPLLFSNVETWSNYARFTGLLFPATINSGLCSAISACVTHELACERFSLTTLIMVTNLIWISILYMLMGIEYFRGLGIPDSLLDTIKALPVQNLSFLVWSGLIFSAIQLVVILLIRPIGKRS